MILCFREWFLAENTVAQFVKTNPEAINIYKTVQLPLNINPKIAGMLRKWVVYQILQGDKDIVGKLADKHILFDNEDRYNLAKKLNDPGYKLANLTADNHVYHQNISREQSKVYKEPVRILELPPINGLQWGSLDTGYCKKYGDSMGHCGNVAHQPGDNILTLFDPKTNIHYLTFILNKGILGEMKSRNNQKPSAKFHANIVQLLLSSYVKTIKGLGYKPENNFQFEDLLPTTQEQILQQKPDIDNYVKHKTKGQYPYIDEDEHILFDRNLPNEDFMRHAERFNNASQRNTLVSVAGEYRRRQLPLPERLKDSILNDADVAMQYALQYFKPHQEPSEFLQAIAKDTEATMLYAVDMYGGKDVPSILLDKIRRQNQQGRYAGYLLLADKKVPADIWEEVKKYQLATDTYMVLHDHRKDIPSSVYDALTADDAFDMLFKIMDNNLKEKAQHISPQKVITVFHDEPEAIYYLPVEKLLEAILSMPNSYEKAKFAYTVVSNINSWRTSQKEEIVKKLIDEAIVHDSEIIMKFLIYPNLTVSSDMAVNLAKQVIKEEPEVFIKYVSREINYVPQSVLMAAQHLLPQYRVRLMVNGAKHLDFGNKQGAKYLLQLVAGLGHDEEKAEKRLQLVANS